MIAVMHICMIAVSHTLLFCHILVISIIMATGDLVNPLSLIFCIFISFKGTKIKSEMVDSFADLLKNFSSIQELKYVKYYDALVYKWKFSPGESFANLAICSHLRKFLSHKFFLYDYIEDMMTFTTLAKVCSTEYFCNTNVAGLGESFVKRKFSCIK